MSAVVEVRDLTKVYRVFKKEPGLAGAVKGLFSRRYEEVRAADAVSFQIQEGEFVGFLGPNGAGKTTVLKMLSGLLNPTSGSASVLGFTPWARENAFKRQFSLLMGQKNALWWDLPARESLELNRAIYEIPEAQYREVVGSLTELLGVRDKLDTIVRELSLGERMKMELISALLHRPRVLFLDEPTIGLDVVSQKKVREFLRDYNVRHRIVTVLTSHYMGDIEELCARVIIIDHGKLFFDGPLDEITARFAQDKIVAFEFEDQQPERAVPAGCGQLLERTPTSFRLQVPRAEVAEVCRRMFAEYRVKDLEVQETPIEDVIRRLFDERRPAAAEAAA
ncbi:MAG: ATP-binding cassette domain-containing protein [Verrucomicrobia bacterium]|nr:ATP-binding cassette domain-containing protein [Verrucomicrobiota bacterium]